MLSSHSERNHRTVTLTSVGTEGTADLRAVIVDGARPLGVSDPPRMA